MHCRGLQFNVACMQFMVFRFFSFPYLFRRQMLCEANVVSLFRDGDPVGPLSHGEGVWQPSLPCLVFSLAGSSGRGRGSSEVAAPVLNEPLKSLAAHFSPLSFLMQPLVFGSGWFSFYTLQHTHIVSRMYSPTPLIYWLHLRYLIKFLLLCLLFGII